MQTYNKNTSEFKTLNNKRVSISNHNKIYSYRYSNIEHQSKTITNTITRCTTTATSNRIQEDDGLKLYKINRRIGITREIYLERS